MKSFTGKTLRWNWNDGVVELTLDREPANEIGTAMLAELEKFVGAFDALTPETSVCIISSARKHGFSAGADLRELYEGATRLEGGERLAGVRQFLERLHAVLNAIDEAAFVTIAAVHGICFGGGLELALVCDIIVADKMARFAFPELRLGLIPGFGGIPRLKRDLGNGFVRDLLFTGRSVNAARAQAVGLVSQLAAEGEALNVARSNATQIKKFDPFARAATKKFLKPIPHEELRREIDLFCELFTRPAVMAALKKFVD
ncbi:MAG TPA: enoyl-CoA hydratase/isomerase family protein, partial [Methylomirabilota bacterium]|nr:enoyl-CoA hydratase/isomerase family protein [Methylomirabilota bacterium]